MLRALWLCLAVPAAVVPGAGAASTYLGGPSVSNTRHSSHCSTWYGSQSEAEELCDASPGCTWLHDFNCDGVNWRFCPQPLDTIGGADLDTLACTLVRNGSTLGGAPEAAGPKDYVEGPRVGNDVHLAHCSTWYGSRNEAEANCTRDDSCVVLHDYACDGQNWRYCMEPLEAIQAVSADTSACTLLRNTTELGTRTWTTTAPGDYTEGPRVGNNVHSTYCSTWYGSRGEAEAMCSGDDRCALLHDFACDGHNWRYCTQPLEAIQAVSADTSACTLLRDPSELGTWTTTAPGPDDYLEGPRVGNNVHITHCSTSYGSRGEAESNCSHDDSCAVLHDFACDGHNWRYCTQPLGAIQAASADTSACTLLRNSAELGTRTWTTTAPGTDDYSEGPRVGNDVHSAHCSTWYGPRDEAEARCNADASCGVLHDFNCDGVNWRYCALELQALQAASAGTGACTLLRNASALGTKTATTTEPGPEANYLGGPRMGNIIFQTHCSTWYGPLGEAAAWCDANTSCTFLHDFGCDGANWRLCAGAIAAAQASSAETSACTLLQSGPDATATTTSLYL